MTTKYLFLVFLIIFTFLGCTAANTTISSLNSHARFPKLREWCINTNPSRTIKIGIDDRFTVIQKEWIEESLGYLHSYGIEGTVETTNNIDLEIRRWYNQDSVSILFSKSQRCRDGKLGQYRRNTNFVQVDPTCSETQQQFMAVVIHEIGHWLGMGHVCKEDGKTTDSCSPVGRGNAIMNPYIAADHSLTPTRLDIIEFNRALNIGCNSIRNSLLFRLER